MSSVRSPCGEGRVSSRCRRARILCGWLAGTHIHQQLPHALRRFLSRFPVLLLIFVLFLSAHVRCSCKERSTVLLEWRLVLASALAASQTDELLFQTELNSSSSPPHSTMPSSSQPSSSQPNGATGEPAGRAFFNSFFNDALQAANLQETSLRASSSGAASTSQLAGNGLDCGRDPGPSTEALEAMSSATLTRSSSSGDSRDDEEARDQLSADSLANRRGRGADLTASSSSIASLTASMRDASVSSAVARSSAAQGTHMTPHPILSRQSSFSLRSGARTPVMDKDGLGFPGE